jgi:hypothetical protein
MRGDEVDWRHGRRSLVSSAGLSKATERRMDVSIDEPSIIHNRYP